MNSPPLLQVRNLMKTYDSGTQALRGVSFDVKAGEFLVVIGLSGSGKSTLLRCLNRLHAPTSGEILWCPRQQPSVTPASDSNAATEQNLRLDIAGLTSARELREVRRRIAMIFQNFNLIPRHSVLSNVLMGRLGATPTWRSLLGLFKSQDVTEALRYLDLVGISEKAQIRADQLSGGQQQRVAIARALAQTPEILLADEPVASLDPATCHVIMDYLRKVNQELGITIICNLHFLSLVREYATRVIALKEGQIVFDGEPRLIDEDWFQKIYGQGAKDIHVH